MVNSRSESYKAAGVDVTAGYEAVKKMKPFVESTYIPGVLGSIGGFGGIQLCQSSGAGLFRNRILHEKNLPSHQSARRKRDRKGDRKIVACPPQHPAAESFVPTK